jgi:DNA-binding transcriptional MerR regulator
MLIGELSKKTGFSRDTIRYYEKLSLIRVNRKERRGNNYKEYSDSVLNQLYSIHRLKEFGFTLTEISELLGMIKSNAATCKYVEGLVNQKTALIDRKIAELQSLKESMQQQVAYCWDQKSQDLSNTQNCPIL